MKGRGGCVRSFGNEHDLRQAEKAANTDSRTNYAVKYATARGHLTNPRWMGGVEKLVHGRDVNRPRFWDDEVGPLLI